MNIRKSRNRIIAEVAAGIAEYQGWKVSLVRGLWIIGSLISGGTVIVAYGLLAMLMQPASDFDINDYRD